MKTRTITTCIAVALCAALAAPAGIASGAIVTPVTEQYIMAESGRFGWSVAMDGDLTIVGACRDVDNGTQAGAAYVYDTATATELYKLTPTDGDASDQFGTGVAVSGNYAVIGAAGKESLVGAAGMAFGAAYVFDLTTGNQVAKLVPNVEMSMGMVGMTVAMDGNNVTVSGKWYDPGGGVNAGAVFRYELDNLVPHSSAPGTFVENQMLVSPRIGGPNFGFGGSMAIDGTTLIVGEKAPAFQDGIAGMAHLFDVSTGTLLGSFMGDDTNLSDSFGLAVAIDGNMAAVGSDSLNTVGVRSGTAYMFDITDPAAVVQNFKLEEAGAAGGVVDNFGLHLDLEDGVLLVSCQSDDDGFSNAGSAFLFDATTGAQLQKFFPSDPQSGALFGWDVAMSGDYLVVGALEANQAYIFEGVADAPGDFDGDSDINEVDIDLLADAIRTSSTNFALFDISADGTTSGTDGAIDINDLNYLVRVLVDTTMGVGTGSEYGDFNLDGLVDTTDLTRLATYFGPGTTWAEGNANRNIDLMIDTTDLTILGTYFGFDASVDAIPEPMTLSLLTMGGLVVLRRQRR